MKTISALLVLGMVLTINQAFAQGMGARLQASERKYDPSTQTKVSGTIKAVEKQMNESNGYAGIHLLIQTTSEELPVHLGPEWYLSQQSISFQAGDKVEVEGSRVIVDRKPALIARQVKKGMQTLELRNKDGIPLWSHSRRR